MEPSLSKQISSPTVLLPQTPRGGARFFGFLAAAYKARCERGYTGIVYIFPIVILALVILGLKRLIAKDANRVGVMALVAGLISVTALPLIFLISLIFPPTVWFTMAENVTIGGFFVGPVAIGLGIFAWRSKPATGATAIASGIMGLFLSYMYVLAALGAAA